MIKVGKNNLKLINYDKELGNSSFEFKASGDNIDYIVMNTIRRSILADIPIYAFDDFKFEKNNSIFHNNYLKLRLRHMPVWSIENTIDSLDVTLDTNVKNDDDDDDIESDDNVELEVEKNATLKNLNQLTMYINYKNKTNDIITVTTNEAKFYNDGKLIKSPYTTEIPIVKLHPNQEICFSAITKIGIEETDSMYSAVTVVYYKQIKDNEFDFIIESRGQITEQRILQVALINIEKRLQNFSKLLDNIEKDNLDLDKEGMLTINNEDHTLGNLICRGLQQHGKVDFAGYNLPHPLAKKVNFSYKLKSGNIIIIMKEVIDYYYELFDQIKKTINKL